MKVKVGFVQGNGGEACTHECFDVDQGGGAEAA